CESLVVLIPTTRSRVDCGLGLVMLSFSPTIRLRRVDFPTFGLPTTVTIPAFGMPEDTANCELAATDCELHKKKDRSQKKKTAQMNYERSLRRCRRRPTLPRSLERSTIGAAGLNDRVRNGNGCGPCASVASENRLSKIESW